MGVAARLGVQRPAFRFFSSARCAHVGPLQRPPQAFDQRDRALPPNPASSIVLTTALTTSKKRRTGGSVETRGRATSRSAPVASVSHLAIVSVDTRNISAVSRCERPRRLLIRKIRKRCSGA